MDVSNVSYVFSHGGHQKPSGTSSDTLQVLFFYERMYVLQLCSLCSEEVEHNRSA